MILINSPNNPAGYVLDRDNLTRIADLAKERDLMVISDECYDEFVYGQEHISIATLPDMRERTLVVKSTSKQFSMTGWRIGYILGPENAINTSIRFTRTFLPALRPLLSGALSKRLKTETLS